MKKKIIICLSIILALVLGICVKIKKNSLYDQSAAARWSPDGMVAQLSLFYPVSETALLDDMHFTDLAHRIQNKLDESAYSTEAGKKDKTGISFPYALSITGKITMTSDSSSAQMNAYGVKGDFFIFHPMNLLSGSYLSDDDVMDDGVVLDEEAAWKLFGSPDIEGKTVTIGGVPHIVKGVIRKDEGKFAEAAGLNGPLCFVSLKSLQTYGSVCGSYAFEMIMSDPVDGFALKLVREVLGDEADDIVIVENSYRYDQNRALDILKNKGIRSMSTKGVVFPYYENIARGWEDIFAVVYLIIWIIIAINLILLAVFIARVLRSRAYKEFKKRIRHNIKLMFKQMIKEEKIHEERE